MYKINFLFVILIFLCLSANGQIGGTVYAWDEYDPAEFGPKISEFDFDGLADIPQAPEAFVHPRLLFTPIEIPEIKERMSNTQSGIAVMRQIHAYTTLLHKGYSNGGTYNHNEEYAKDAFGNRLIDNAGFWDSKFIFDKLINEDPSAFDNTDLKRRSLLANVMAWEAYECMIFEGDFDEDTGKSYEERSILLAKAMEYWAVLVLDDPNLNPDNYNLFGGESMAYCYDIHFNKMNSFQQDKVREALSHLVGEFPIFGTGVTHHAIQSNWTTLNSFEPIINFAIEGEPGYKEIFTRRYMLVLRNFLEYGWYASGAGYEGLGKNYQFVTHLIVYAKRGYSLLGHPHVRAYGERFLPHMMQPYGDAFSSYDVWGGSGFETVKGQYKFNASDAVGLKWAFPNSQAIDFVWRNYINKFYKLIDTDGYVYQQIVGGVYHNYLLPAAVFAKDYAGDDWESTNEETLGSLDFFGPERGLMVSRSDFTKDAIALQFHCRQDLGGHTHADRNSFSFSALGRMWVKKPFGREYQESDFHSMILVNDLGIKVNPKDGKKARQPGIILNYEATDDYSYIRGDATFAYSYEWDWEPRLINQDHSKLGIDNWEKVDKTWGDFRYIGSQEYYHDISFYEYPDWNKADHYERMIQRPYNPMEKVIRSAHVFRSDNPYVIILDDIKKDENSNVFEWIAPLADDLFIDDYVVSEDLEDYRNDLILSEPSGLDNRKLLVRILNADGFIEAKTEIHHHSTNGDSILRLNIHAESVEPNFQILLFPLNDEIQIPLTKWNQTKDTLIIQNETWSDTLCLMSNGVFTHISKVTTDMTSHLQQIEEVEFEVVPNSLLTGEEICIHGNESWQSIDLINSNGEVVERLIKTDDCIRLDEGLKSGLYFLKIYHKSGFTSKTIFISGH